MYRLWTFPLILALLWGCGGKKSPTRSVDNGPVTGEVDKPESALAKLGARLMGATGGLDGAKALLLTPRVAMATKSYEEQMVQFFGGGNEPVTARPAKTARNFLIIQRMPADITPLFEDTDDAVNASKSAKPAAVIWEADTYSSDPFHLAELPLRVVNQNTCEIEVRNAPDNMSQKSCLLVVDTNGRMMGYIYRQDEVEGKSGDMVIQFHYRRMPFGGKKKQALAKAASTGTGSGGTGKRRVVHTRIGTEIKSAAHAPFSLTFSADNAMLYAWPFSELQRLDLKKGKIETIADFGDNYDGAAIDNPLLPKDLQYVQPFEQGFVIHDLVGVRTLPARPKAGTEYPITLAMQTRFSPCDRHGRNWVEFEGGNARVHRLGRTSSSKEFPGVSWAARDEHGELIFPSVDLSRVESKADLKSLSSSLVRVKLDGSLSVSTGKFVIPAGVRAVNRQRRVFFAPEGIVPIMGGTALISMKGWEYTAPGPGRDMVRWRDAPNQRNELEIFDGESLRLRARTTVDGDVSAAFSIRKGPWLGVVAVFRKPAVVELIDEGRLTKLQ
jgi:hypothetical protein